MAYFMFFFQAPPLRGILEKKPEESKMAAHMQAIWVAALCMAALGTLYKIGDIQDWKNSALRTAFKGCATASAAALALYAYFLGGGRYAGLIALGLTICALADMVLEKDLMAGAAVFFVGHAAYIAAFLLSSGFTPLSLRLYGALVLAVVMLARFAMKAQKGPVLPFALYAFMLCLMMSLAWGHSLIAGLGATLFVISDGLIGYAQFVRPSALNGIGCIVLYYTAQFLLALSAMAGI